MSGTHGGIEDNNTMVANQVAAVGETNVESGASKSSVSIERKPEEKQEVEHDIEKADGDTLQQEHKTTESRDRTTDFEKEQEDQSNRRTAIENEAIQHLARRASEMTINSAATTQSPIAVHRDAKLPAAPPPPTPPEKGPFALEENRKSFERPGYDEKRNMEETSVSEVATASQDLPEQTGEEIQHIMDQFAESQTAPGEEEIMSPILERQQPILSLPPRSSSLESREKYVISPIEQPARDAYFATSGSRRGSVISQAPASAMDDTSSIRSHRTSIFQPPPPSPDPETALPFDFHRFLEQLRHRTADPVARFLRSFLQEFGKKQWMAHEQVKIIGDFLEFISKKMAQCDVWRTVPDAEFDNAREGMEKLVMNRLYMQTFSPAIAPPSGSPRKGTKSRSVADAASSSGAGRRGQHQEDVERDEVIAQKMRIYGWIKEEHLDIKPIGDKGKKFLTMAQQELLKINTYRAPRDKVICVLNCCKVIFGFLKNSKGDQSADSFVPLLIYTVLQARPEHLVSNVQYIWRFRNQEKLGGEAGYYMSSLMGVVQFVENLDRTVITISDEEFESHVEQAVSAIAEGHQAENYEEKSHNARSIPRSSLNLSDKSTISRPEVTPRTSVSQQTSPRKQKTGAVGDEDDTDAMTGLLRSIQKPLSSIGRIFSDEGSQQSEHLRPSSTPLPPRTSLRALSPAGRGGRSASQGRRTAQPRLVTDDAAARQASVETADAQRERQRGFAVVVETLQGMFPNLDKEIIEDVVRAQEGHVGRAVDACLALSDQG